MIAGLTAGLDCAFLFALEKLNQFCDCCFFDSEALLAGMILTAIEVADPGRLRSREKL